MFVPPFPSTPPLQSPLFPKQSLIPDSSHIFFHVESMFPLYEYFIFVQFWWNLRCSFHNSILYILVWCNLRSPRFRLGARQCFFFSHVVSITCSCSILITFNIHIFAIVQCTYFTFFNFSWNYNLFIIIFFSIHFIQNIKCMNFIVRSFEMYCFIHIFLQLFRATPPCNFYVQLFNATFLSNFFMNIFVKKLAQFFHVYSQFHLISSVQYMNWILFYFFFQTLFPVKRFLSKVNSYHGIEFVYTIFQLNNIPLYITIMVHFLAYHIEYITYKIYIHSPTFYNKYSQIMKNINK